jgi:hypothetical protein
MKNDKSREVIAHFSASYLTFMALIFFVFIGLDALMARDKVFGPVDDPIERGLYAWGFVLVTIALMILFVGFFRTVRAAVTNKSVALWLEDGRLVYANKKLLDVRARDVLSVDVKREIVRGTTALRAPRATWMVFRLRDGTEAKIPVSVLVENRDDIVANLRERLGVSSAHQDSM